MLFGSACDDLTDLMDGEHRRAALRVQGKGPLIHKGDLLDEDDPHGASAGLRAEYVGKLQDRHIKVLIRKALADLFLLDTAADIGVLFADRHIRALFGKPAEIRAEHDRALEAHFLAQRQDAL